jgi:hypothetical protein
MDFLDRTKMATSMVLGEFSEPPKSVVSLLGKELAQKSFTRPPAPMSVDC